MLRDGLRNLLAKSPEIDVVGTAANGSEALDLLADTGADLVFMDIQMPVMNGIEATRRIREAFPDTKVLALTMIDETDTLTDMMEAGARGYLLKDAKKSELVEAALAVANGGLYFCTRANPKVLELLTRSRMPALPRLQPDLFSEKELRIIELLCKEYSSKQIAPEVGLTEYTVEAYRKKIMVKMGVQNIAGLVVWAVKNGMVTV